MDEKTQERLKEINFDIEQLSISNNSGIRLLIEHAIWLLQLVHKQNELLKKYGNIIRLATEYTVSEQDTVESSTKKLALILAVNDLEEE